MAWDYKSSRPDTAIVLANQVLDILQTADSIGFSKPYISYAAAALYTIGRAYSDKINYPYAVGSLQKALNLYDKLGNKQGTAKCNQDIGLVYYRQKDYESAFGYLQKALQLNKDCGNLIGEASCYHAVGVIYTKKNNYTKALEYNFMALHINQELHNKNAVSVAYNNIGENYRLQADDEKKQGLLAEAYTNYKQVIEYYLKSLRLDKEINDREGIAIDYLNIALLSNGLGKYKTAILYCDSSLKLSKEIGDKKRQGLAFEALAEAYNKTRQYKKAYESYVQFKAASDAFIAEETKKKKEQAALQYEYDKRELLRNAQQELQKQQPAKKPK